MWPFAIPLVSAFCVVGRSLATSSGGESLYRRISTRQHRAEAAPAEEVDVEVGHLLAAMRADIGEQAVAGRDQRLVAGDPAHRADEACDLGVARMFGEIVPRDVAPLRDDEDVDRRLRIDV